MLSFLCSDVLLVTTQKYSARSSIVLEVSDLDPKGMEKPPAGT